MNIVKTMKSIKGMKGMRRISLAAASLGLVIVVNLAMLLGVAWNRSALDAELVLTERELAPRGGLFDEDGGRFVRLRLRGDECGGYPCAPPWLDEAKRAELGIRPGSGQRGEGMKRVLLVLELDGPAAARSLARKEEELARRQQERDQAAAALREEAAPSEERVRLLERAKTQAETALRSARDALERERTRASRLFVVDAGLKVRALRDRYPDRTRYALTPGLLRWQWRSRSRAESPRLQASAEPERGSLFVPRDFARDFAVLRSGRPATLRLAFGRRLAPWVKDLRAAAERGAD